MQDKPIVSGSPGGPEFEAAVSVRSGGAEQSSQRRANGTLDTPLRKPHRLWMTGSFAVVMAALGPVQDRISTKRVFRQSPYSVHETVQRLEAEARQQGLSVLAETDDAQPVIVLGSSIGGTPVVMDRANSRPDVPLSVGVRERAGGGVEVLLADAAEERDSDWADLPTEVTHDLAALPGWVDRALS